MQGGLPPFTAPSSEGRHYSAKYETDHWGCVSEHYSGIIPIAPEFRSLSHRQRSKFGKSTIFSQITIAPDPKHRPLQPTVAATRRNVSGHIAMHGWIGLVRKPRDEKTGDFCIAWLSDLSRDDVSPDFHVP